MIFFSSLNLWFIKIKIFPFHKNKETDKLKNDGWVKLQDMKIYGFNTTVWTICRAPLEDQDLYLMGRLNKKEWLNAGVVRLIQAFNLSEHEVLGIRRTFEDIIGISVVESVRIADVLKHFVSFFRRFIFYILNTLP